MPPCLKPWGAVLTTSYIDEAVKTADHGFKQVTAPDGYAAIEVKITSTTGKEVTYLLSTGARGRSHEELPRHGKDQLNGARLLSRREFEVVASSLFQAIRGLEVVDGVLQTEDPVLRKAHRMVTAGVYTVSGCSFTEFTLNSDRVVVNWRVTNLPWGLEGQLDYAAFLSPPEES